MHGRGERIARLVFEGQPHVDPHALIDAGVEGDRALILRVVAVVVDTGDADDDVALLAAVVAELEADAAPFAASGHVAHAEAFEIDANLADGNRRAR
jgi:hypothetical protein